MLEWLTRRWHGRCVFLSARGTMLAEPVTSPESSVRNRHVSTDGSGPLRRVVTEFDANGNSTVVMDGAPPPRAIYNEVGKYYGYNAWLLRAVPADLNDPSDPIINGYDPTSPPEGGIVIRITTFVPGYTYPMHKTDTVDFGIVLSGSIEMGLETGTVMLTAGDIIVQKGTLHSWRSVDGPCTVAFVLADAKPRSR